jgi:Phage integrase family
MLRRALERAHINGPVSFHTLRHSFATRLVAANVDIKTVSTILGHSTSRLLLERYAHEAESRKTAALAANPGAVGHIVGTPGWAEQKTWTPTDEKIEELWWTAGGSNSRPPRCERGALPTELAAHCDPNAKSTMLATLDLIWPT